MKIFTVLFGAALSQEEFANFLLHDVLLTTNIDQGKNDCEFLTCRPSTYYLITNIYDPYLFCKLYICLSSAFIDNKCESRLPVNSEGKLQILSLT